MAPSKIRVLVVDDSAFMRKALSLMIKATPDVEVAGEAVNGEEAVAKTESLKPDVITMDLEMPVRDGFWAIEEIRKRGISAPVLVVSSLAQEGAEATFRALSLGAVDFVPKPSSFVSLSIQEIEREFLEKIRAVAAGAKRRVPGRAVPAAASPVPTGSPAAPGKVRLVVLGSSTGGPEALGKVLSAIPADFPVPIVIAQHMPESFTGVFAKRLNQICPIGAREIQGGETLGGKPTVYLGKGHHHVLLKADARLARTELSAERMGSFYLPSADVLFTTASEAVGAAGLLCVVLTGMGEDGKKGAAGIHQGGGRVIVQDEATSVVWGMPGSVAAAGAADEVLPVGEIGGRVAAVVGSGAGSKG